MLSYYNANKIVHDAKWKVWTLWICGVSSTESVLSISCLKKSLTFGSACIFLFPLPVSSPAERECCRGTSHHAGPQEGNPRACQCSVTFPTLKCWADRWLVLLAQILMLDKERWFSWRDFWGSMGEVVAAEFDFSWSPGSYLLSCIQLFTI